MPAPGQQHDGIANPFEEVQPRMSEYTATRIATLQSRLQKQLGPEYLSARAGPSGAKVHYIAAEKCISLANDIFGFDGWSSSIQNIQVDFVDENPQTLKISLGLSVVVRVTLREGTYHEDIGYGHIENCKGKAAAFEKAKKEGTTDALKRALRNFGNALGNCIYDKDYLAKVTKIKAPTPKFDEDNLYRHPSFAKKEPEPPKVPVKVEVQKPPAGSVAGSTANTPSLATTDSLVDDDFGDFDMADFGVTEDGHPDEITLPTSNGLSNDNQNGASIAQKPPPHNNQQNQMQPPSKPPARNVPNQPQQPPHQRGPQTPNQAHHRPNAPGQARPNSGPMTKPPFNKPMPPAHSAAQQAANANRTGTPPPPNGGANGAASEPVSFFSARSVPQLAEGAPAESNVIPSASAKVFDPRAESPSIRKTPGIDHQTSRPVGKNGQHVAPVKAEKEQPHAGSQAGGGVASPGLSGAGPGPGRPGMGGIGNPSLNHARQIGAPGGGGSPLANRGQYRPPSFKRPAPGPAENGSRPPLTEASTNIAVNNGPGATVDTKRQKMA